MSEKKADATQLEAEGIIAPRLKLSEVIARDPYYGSPQKGAIIYVSEIDDVPEGLTEKVEKEGYYYFDGTAWIPLSSNASGGIWYEVGVDKPSKTNKTNSYLDAQVVIGDKIIADVNGGTENAQLTVVGGDAVINGVTVGAGKSGFGTALGFNALSEDEAGSSNTAVGYFALAENIDGSYNTAIGAYANSSISGMEGTVAMGYNSKTEGNNAIAIGFQAEANAKNAIAIGYSVQNNSANTTFIKNRSTVVGNDMTGSANVTLQALGEPANTAKADGVMAPLITRAQLQAKENNNPKAYGTDQRGTLIYVTTIDGNTPAALSQTEYVTSPGYYYFNPDLGSAGQWLRFSTEEFRHSNVYINPAYGNDPSTGFYKDIQTAYNSEARKLYNPGGNNDGKVNFICRGSGSIKALNANGAIPNIQISFESSDVSIDSLILSNTVAMFYSPSTVTMNTGPITADGSNITLAGTTQLKADRGITISRSAFYAMLPGSSKITTDFITVSFGFLWTENCNITITKSPNFTETPYACIESGNGSYVELGNNSTITLSQASTIGIRVHSGATLQCKGSTINIGTGFGNDFLAETSSSLIMDAGANGATIVNGESESTTFMVANSLAKVSLKTATITRTNITANGIECTDGALISMNGYGAKVNISPKVSGSTYGIYANGGDVKVLGGSGSTKNIDVSKFWRIHAASGAVINTMGRINYAGTNLTPGTPSKTGAVIYASSAE
ncbi:MAG: hypothetical protein ACLVKO_03735 [Dysgonomonas sp.]